jgi:hypothetical protein
MQRTDVRLYREGDFHRGRLPGENAWENRYPIDHDRCPAHAKGNGG